MDFFSNVGNKLKLVAFIFFAIGVISSFIGAIIFWVEMENFGLGLLILVGGPFVSWLTSLPLYGFGQLIETTEDNQQILLRIAGNTGKIASSTQNTNKPSNTAPKAKQPSASKPASTVTTPAPVNPVSAKPVSAPAPIALTPDEKIDAEKEKLYIYAVQMFEQRSYNIAFNLFNKLDNYKDTQEYLDKIKPFI